MVLGTHMCVRGDPIEWHVISEWQYAFNISNLVR